MRTFKLTVAYDGTDFFGWQFQPGRRTVQQTLQETIGRVTKASVTVTASGRTDAGVHALGQAVGFTTDCQLPLEIIVRAVNAELPKDVAILNIEEVATDFDAIRHVERKRYRYVIQDGPITNVFARRYSWHVYRRLDADAMRRSAQALVGTHDFKSFATSGSIRATTIRTVCELTIERRQPALGGNPVGSGSAIAAMPGEIQIEIEANGFLYHMVRNIVGTLVSVGRGIHDESWPGTVLAGLDRKAAGCAAPPQGLFLVRVQYAGSRETGVGSREQGRGGQFT